MVKGDRRAWKAAYFEKAQRLLTQYGKADDVTTGPGEVPRISVLKFLMELYCKPFLNNKKKVHIYFAVRNPGNH